MNHGCEAIVRSTYKVLGKKDITLFSSAVNEDHLYALDEIVTLKEDKNLIAELGTKERIIASVSHKLRHDDYLYYSYGHKEFFRQIRKGDICMSIGGDNYCYPGQDILGYYNKRLRKCGAKTILWGCSIDPDMVDEKIKQDLASYGLIFARETLSYEYLKTINPNTYLCCDPAFQLDSSESELPEKFIEGRTVGINVSPLARKYGNPDLIMKNYSELIDHIIRKTEYQIAMIPHVIKDGDDDRKTLKELYDTVEKKSRIVMIEDMNCMKIKGVIRKCELFIGARTHSTIAAYSTCVPALVTGYSVKAKGIARDLFGTDENYVVPVQTITDSKDLTDAFCWLDNNKKSIRNHLNQIMPSYSESVLKMKEHIFN